MESPRWGPVRLEEAERGGGRSFETNGNLHHEHGHLTSAVVTEEAAKPRTKAMKINEFAMAACDTRLLKVASAPLQWAGWQLGCQWTTRGNAAGNHSDSNMMGYCASVLSVHGGISPGINRCWMPANEECTSKTSVASVLDATLHLQCSAGRWRAKGNGSTAAPQWVL